jgi:phytoene dehydrogenase-like protein
VLLDVTPSGLLALAGDRLPSVYRRLLRRYRYGPGVFKLDWALDGPIPWRAEECARAATVHLGGTLDEIAASEAAPSQGEIAEQPYVLLAQQSLFDPTRAPGGRHTAWAYCHVPNGSNVDMAERIESQVERFAPGFRDRILARSARGPAEMERDNANYVGGDINAGAATLSQLFTRPVARVSPYTTPLPGVFLCSASTPPGGGVHGMCGYHAAQAALRSLRR